MLFNDDKCFTLHTTRKRKTVEYNYMLHDHKLEVTTDSKYLGVTISNDLSWATRISNISAKANRTLIRLWSLLVFVRDSQVKSEIIAFTEPGSLS